MKSMILLLCISFVIPVFYVIYGTVLFIKEVPFLSPYGFVTLMSKKNKQVWDFANRKFGKKLVTLGIAEIIISLFMLLSVVIDPPQISAGEVLLITCSLELFSFAVPAGRTVKLIERHFDSDGRAKDF